MQRTSCDSKTKKVAMQKSTRYDAHCWLSFQYLGGSFFSQARLQSVASSHGANNQPLTDGAPKKAKDTPRHIQARPIRIANTRATLIAGNSDQPSKISVSEHAKKMPPPPPPPKKPDNMTNAIAAAPVRIDTRRRRKT